MAKKKISLRAAVFLSVGVGITCILIGIIISRTINVYYPNLSFSPSTTTNIVTTPTISSTPLPQVTQNAISNIDVYEKISAQAIQSSNHALEQMKWVMVTLLPILVAIAGGIISYFIKAQKDLLDYSNGIRNELNEAVQKLIVAEKQTTAISSNYIYVLSELSHQSLVFLPPEVAISAFDQGKISKDEFRESQIWLAWVKWFYMDKEEGFLELEVYKDSIQSLPHSIRRIMIVEIERIKDTIKRRGMIYKKEDELLKKLLLLLDLKIIDNTSPA